MFFEEKTLGYGAEGGLEPHELPHTPLKRARLPVPPLRLKLSDNDGNANC